MTHEARILVMAMMAVCSAVALAMPTQQELKKAQPLVAELMAPTMDDFKAKKKTAAEVADAAVKYAGEAETEAAKFMLYRSSIPYYVKGEAYDKAADAVEQMKANVKGVPPSVVEEIISKATVRATAKKAPRLFELYRQAKAQSVAEKDIAAFRAKLKKNPDSQPNTRNLAEALATFGDWDAALKEFAKLKDKTAQMAKGEQDGSAKSASLGEFWWSYKPTYENAEDTFEMRAAVHYRKALAAGEITGLKKNIVEQRIAKYGNVSESCAAASTAVAKTTGPIELKTGGKSPFTVNGNVATLDLGEKYGKLEFVKCPAGSVKMVTDKNGGNVRVNISRPFWIMKSPFRWKQAAVCPNIPYGGKDTVMTANRKMDEMICRYLTSEFEECLPKGMIVRLPTLAELEYAFHANTHDRSDPYYDLQRIHVDDDVGKARSAKTNAWGMKDFGSQRVLDVFDPAEHFVASTNETGGLDVRELKKPSNLTDALYWTESPKRMNMHRGVDWNMWWMNNNHENDWGPHTRLVIGPDLVSEWKAKNAKK